MGKKFTEEEILEEFRRNLELKVIQEQLEYYWIRIYTNKEYDFKQGDVINLDHLPTGESFPLMFTNYDKMNKTSNQSMALEEFETEDNKKCLCLLVDITTLYKLDNVNFIRTLFRKSKFYQDQLLKRKDLIFSSKLNEGIVIEYYDIIF